MSSYSKNKKLIRDYINGNDISVDVETLENDLDFMIAVIDYSGDSNLYKLCSDDIKYNFELIKFLVEKFHDNKEFIIEIVLDFLNNYDHVNWYKQYEDNFLDETHADIEELEVLITIDKYLKEELDERIIDIKMRLKSEFVKFRVDLETVINSDSEDNFKYKVGKGFNLIEMMFPTSYLIKDFYAKEIICEIFRECEGNNFEEKVHNMCGTSEKPESSLRVLINIVKKHDIELSNYIIARPAVFETYINQIDTVITKWDAYNQNKLDDKIYTILDIINDYFYKYEHLLKIDKFGAIKYFAKALDLEERFKVLDPIPFESSSPFDELEKDSYYDQKMVRDLTPIIKGIMEGKNEYEIVNPEVTSPSGNNISQFKPKR